MDDAAAVNALVPLPSAMPVNVATPMPPFDTGRVPVTSEVRDVLPVVSPEPFPRRGPLSVVVTASVPEVVTGEPPTLNPDGIVSPTLVTLPEPAAAQEPSPRRNVPLLHVPENVPTTSVEVAAVVT